jgi:hypothetical protein
MPLSTIARANLLVAFAGHKVRTSAWVEGARR